MIFQLSWRLVPETAAPEISLPETGFWSVTGLELRRGSRTDLGSYRTLLLLLLLFRFKLDFEFTVCVFCWFDVKGTFISLMKKWVFLFFFFSFWKNYDLFFFPHLFFLFFLAFWVFVQVGNFGRLYFLFGWWWLKAFSILCLRACMGLQSMWVGFYGNQLCYMHYSIYIMNIYVMHVYVCMHACIEVMTDTYMWTIHERLIDFFIFWKLLLQASIFLPSITDFFDSHLYFLSIPLSSYTYSLLLTFPNFI